MEELKKRERKEVCRIHIRYKSMIAKRFVLLFKMQTQVLQ